MDRNTKRVAGWMMLASVFAAPLVVATGVMFGLWAALGTFAFFAIAPGVMFVAFSWIGS